MAIVYYVCMTLPFMAGLMRHNLIGPKLQN